MLNYFPICWFWMDMLLRACITFYVQILSYLPLQNNNFALKLIHLKVTKLYVQKTLFVTRDVNLPLTGSMKYGNIINWNYISKKWDDTDRKLGVIDKLTKPSFINYGYSEMLRSLILEHWPRLYCVFLISQQPGGDLCGHAKVDSVNQRQYRPQVR